MKRMVMLMVAVAAGVAGACAQDYAVRDLYVRRVVEFALQSSTPSNPPSGSVRLFTQGTGLYALYSDGTVHNLDSAGAGGSATPGGSSGDLQYNNAGAFGGTSGVTWDGTTLKLTGKVLNMVESGGSTAYPFYLNRANASQYVAYIENSNTSGGGLYVNSATNSGVYVARIVGQGGNLSMASNGSVWATNKLGAGVSAGTAMANTFTAQSNTTDFTALVYNLYGTDPKGLKIRVGQNATTARPLSIFDAGDVEKLYVDSYGNVTTTGQITTADDAYNATTWDGNTTLPTKNAVRDKIESMGGGGTPGGSTTQFQYNNAGAFGGSSRFTWDSGNSRVQFWDSDVTQYFSMVAPSNITTSYVLTWPGSLADGKFVPVITASSNAGTITFETASPNVQTDYGSTWSGSDSTVTARRIYTELTKPRVLFARMFPESDVQTGVQLFMFRAERAMTITKIWCVGGTSINVDIDPEKTAAMGTAGTDFLSSPETVNNSTGGVSFTSEIGVTTIAAGDIVVMVFNSVTTAKWLAVEFIGYFTP